ncbi:MAG TPA: glycerophosphodiester phosphodiesterase [Anaerolineae bacterium]|nr:glycerophosphodiester phosphodiesterase [Anaerolineae bacterium]
MEIVAHRGAHEKLPENTLAAFQQAAVMGADMVEMDVRLTRDHVPVICHYYALPDRLGLPGCVFEYTLSKMRQAEEKLQATDSTGSVAILREVLESLTGRVGLEIEVKGPEPECVEIISATLLDYRRFWDTMELTSYEPALLLALSERCPGLASDLLYPPSEPWKTLDIVAYEAKHLGRLARARAVHLHHTQLSEQVVAGLAAAGLETHVWGANDENALQQCRNLGLKRACTDQLSMALGWRSRAAAETSAAPE